MPYLFVHFIGEEEEGEQVYFSVSRDGMHWNDINNGPILISHTGEHGVRDPFILRSCIDHKYRILATDLRIANNKGWDVAQYAGSTSLIVWESNDLIHWNQEKKINLDSMKEADAGCVWAPEAIYDCEKESYFVYWASMVDKKQRIYAAWTKDFTHYSDFHLYIEKNNHIIDTTMAKEDTMFYRFSACEEYLNIIPEQGSVLDSTDYTPCIRTGIPETKRTEGPIIVWLEELNKWCLYVDDIENNAGYTPFLTNTLKECAFVRVSKDDYDFGVRKKRHGSIIRITDDEYERLILHYGLLK